MFERIRALLLENQITLSAPISLSYCRMIRPHLLEREGLSTAGTAVIFAIPYYTNACESEGRNCSRYAVSRDYHLFVKQLGERILPILKNQFPGNRFSVFADHSPLDERDAAAKAGLGVLGENGLLITREFSSYVFLGAVITDKQTNAPPVFTALPRCRGCGACRRTCAYLCGQAEQCLSEITQKKGALTADQKEQLLLYNTVWGCDRCQEICPYTAEAKKAGTLVSPIPFFHLDPLPVLTYERIAEMPNEVFEQRAYAWRGRGIILRNLLIAEGRDGVSEEKQKE